MTPGYYAKLAQIESGGDPNAANPKSSASGLFQFTAATAQQYGLKDPTDPVEARKAVEKFTADNAKTLETKLGRTPTEGELYLAHQQGAKGALDLLQNPDKPAIEVVGVDQVKNNGGNETMTAQQFADKWTGKFGDAPVAATKQTSTETAPATPAAPVGKTIQLPDGRTIQLTGTETPDVIANIKKKIIEKYSGSINVDRHSGAPAIVRTAVGSVSKPEDRLLTLQQYYPDAFQYGEDNYVFSNPDTGKLTLYNPKGLDIGDAASVAREGVQMVGSTVGAVIGAGLGLAASAPSLGTAAPVTVTAGGIAGSGIGGATAGSAFDMMLNAFGLTKDTRTTPEKALDYAGEAAVFAAADGAGRVVMKGAKMAGSAIKTKAKSIIGSNPASQNLLKQFQSFGIQPSASLITDNAGMARLEAGLQQSPITAETMVKQAENIVQQTRLAVDKTISEVGTPLSKQGAGEVIQKAAINAAERFNFRQEKLYTDVFDMIGGDTPVSVNAANQLLTELKTQVSMAPRSLSKTLNPAINQLEAIVADASDGGIPFSALRNVRTAIGRDLATPMLSGSTGAQNEAMKRIYGALTEDLSAAASSTSGEAAKRLATADRYTRIWSNTAKDTMQKIANFDAEERAFTFAMNGAKDGGSSLNRLRRNFTEEEWDTVAASVLNKLGDATPGMQNAAGDAFSINTFLTNWNRLSPEAKTALFGGKRYAAQREALEKLTGLMDRIKSVSRFNNFSNTAGAMQTQLLLTGLGGATGYIYTGNYTGALAGVGAALTPRMAAKLITNPRFVEWLAEPLATNSAGKGVSAASHISKLAVIAKEEPEIRTEIHEYMKKLKEDTR